MPAGSRRDHLTPRIPRPDQQIAYHNVSQQMEINVKWKIYQKLTIIWTIFVDKTDLCSVIMSAIFEWKIYCVTDRFLIKEFNFEGQSVVPEQEDKVEETEPAF